MAKKAKKAKPSTGGWAEVHKPSGASVIERNAHGCMLWVSPKNWTRRTGESIWSVSCGASGRHERGETSTLSGAKKAAMHSAKKLEREVKSSAKKAKPAPGAKRAKAAGKAKPRKTQKASSVRATRPKAKSVAAPRRESARRHAEDLRQRTASLLAGLPPVTPMSPVAPPSHREMELDIAHVADQG